MLFNSPLSVDRVDALIELLDLSPGAQVLDIGCGTGAMLERVVRRWGARGVGVDNQTACIDVARARAPEIEWRAEAIHPTAALDGSLDMAICVGSTHAFAMGAGATAGALTQCARWLKPGGLLLLGDGLWMAPPDPAYLEFLGEHPGVYRDHADNVALAVEHGYVPLHAIVSTLAEWDAFEWGHVRRGEAEGGARRERVRRWRDAYLKWGRGVMGFGVYLLRTPTPDERVSDP